MPLNLKLQVDWDGDGSTPVPMPELTLSLATTPVAKARPQFVHGSVYTPAATVVYQDAIQVAAMNAILDAGLEAAPAKVPVSARLGFELPMPTSWSKARQQRMIGESHCQRPDVDNLVKPVLDVCAGVVFRDDTQVAELVATKRWSDEGRVCTSFSW